MNFSTIELDKKIITANTKMKIVFLPVILFYFNCYGQTCVMAVKTKDKLYIGADSRAFRIRDTIINGKTVTESMPSTVCKIYNAGSFYFSMAGIANADIIRDMKIIGAYTKNMHEVSKLVYDSVSKRYFNWIYKEENKSLLKKQLGKNNRLISFFIYGHIEMNPYFQMIELYDRGGIGVAQKFNFDSTEGVKFMVIGHHESFPTEKEVLQKLIKSNFTSVINSLIKRETKITPYVALPIDLIELSKNGVRWIQRQKICN